MNFKTTNESGDNNPITLKQLTDSLLTLRISIKNDTKEIVHAGIDELAGIVKRRFDELEENLDENLIMFMPGLIKLKRSRIK
jgi:hypothetical protein